MVEQIPALPLNPAGPDRHWSADIFEVFKQNNISMVLYVPDAGHLKLIELCQNDPGIQAVSLTSEEEGVALSCGAYLGGKRAVLLMQSSGVGNCVNMFSLLKTCMFPFLTIVTMRGDSGEFNPWQVPMGQSVRPVMEASGLIVKEVSEESLIRPSIQAAVRMAFNAYSPVAVLISQDLLGAKTFGRK